MNNKLTQVINQIDLINHQDPHTDVVEGKDIAKSLIYGQRMSTYLNQYWPNANEYLQIAVRAQHIKRWSIARSQYPTGKTGYLTWRKALGVMHAKTTKQLMLEIGYNQSQADQTAAIVQKEQLNTNSDSQTLEDVACLVFLTYYFAPFSEKHSNEKIINIVQKTWQKMSKQAQDIALTITLPSHLDNLVKKALNNKY